MAGYNVLHPMGWDAFGLPAEQYAIDTGTHPSDTTKRNINRFREQLKVCSVYSRHVFFGCALMQVHAVAWIFIRLGPRGCDLRCVVLSLDAGTSLLCSVWDSWARCTDGSSLSPQWIFLRLFERGLAYQVRHSLRARR